MHLVLKKDFVSITRMQEGDDIRKIILGVISEIKTL